MKVVPLAHCFTCCKGRHDKKKKPDAVCSGKHKIVDASVDLRVLSGDPRGKVAHPVASKLRIDGKCADCGKHVGTFASLSKGWVELSAEDRRETYSNAAAAEKVKLRAKKVAASAAGACDFAPHPELVGVPIAAQN